MRVRATVAMPVAPLTSRRTHPVVCSPGAVSHELYKSAIAKYQGKNPGVTANLQFAEADIKRPVVDVPWLPVFGATARPRLRSLPRASTRCSPRSRPSRGSGQSHGVQRHDPHTRQPRVAEAALRQRQGSIKAPLTGI